MTSTPPTRAVARIGLLAGSITLLMAPGARAQQAGYGQTMGTTPMEQQVYGGSGPSSGSGSILNSANPIDLMNKIRKGTALDDATPPSSAIDQALRDFDSQPAPKTAAKPAGPGLSAPGPAMAVPSGLQASPAPVSRKAP